MSNWWQCPRSGHRLLWGRGPDGQSVVSCPSTRCGYAVVVPGAQSITDTKPREDTPGGPDLDA